MYRSNTLPGLTMRLFSLAKADTIITGLRVKRVLIDGIPTWTMVWSEKIVK